MADSGRPSFDDLRATVAPSGYSSVPPYTEHLYTWGSGELGYLSSKLKNAFPKLVPLPLEATGDARQRGNERVTAFSSAAKHTIVVP